MSKKQPDWKEAARKALANLDEISDAEDASISADALADPDNPPADDLLRRRGRPVSPNRKRAIKLRIDPDVIDRFRQSGPGWQSRMNDVLRKAVGL
ncbi:BrnA antitoxin family protein [Allomesorhizobium alhagi]|jgi:uncharacterized protein (DUF4415 family)|uniref:BrnA antitoxin family protein n=1 Tax=Mesorhizobium alhagi CCNWXJ12-2 TaxID=1107882 RepID=H0HTV8_9HYPH|nr:BrnA antitoxin family protein [Mesorhizobium alhagi]EHK55845.1 hypothetical protein MAXJ12_17998 [Mesorhizobium alhagi CCNWXJ12-2]